MRQNYSMLYGSWKKRVITTNHNNHMLQPDAFRRARPIEEAASDLGSTRLPLPHHPFSCRSSTPLLRRFVYTTITDHRRARHDAWGPAEPARVSPRR